MQQAEGFDWYNTGPGYQISVHSFPRLIQASIQSKDGYIQTDHHHHQSPSPPPPITITNHQKLKLSWHPNAISSSGDNLFDHIHCK
jgi:hypothetical protein